MMSHRPPSPLYLWTCLSCGNGLDHALCESALRVGRRHVHATSHVAALYRLEWDPPASAYRRHLLDLIP